MGEQLLTKLLSKNSAGHYTPSCDIGGIQDSVDIYVCQVTGITVAGGAEFIEGNAVTTVDPSGQSYVVLHASVEPEDLPAIPYGLLWWYGASQVSAQPDQAVVPRTNADSRLVTCHCGDSYAGIQVYIIDLDLRAPGIPDDQEDTKFAEIYVNSDDDNGNDIDDRADTEVDGENDLYRIYLTISPGGVPGGTITIRHYNATDDPSEDTDLWEDRRKDTHLETSYSLATGLPSEIWVEGLHVSDLPGDEYVQISYGWGDVSLSDTIRLTVLPRDGDSEASLELYADAAGATEAASVVGGIVYPALHIKVGAGERLSSTTAEVIIRDEYENYFAGTVVDLDLGNGLAPTGGWQKKNAAGQWVADDGPVGSDNKDGSEPIEYRAMLPAWNTMKQPLGNNGPHCVFVGEQDEGQWQAAHVEFEEWEVGQGWVDAYENGPLGRGVETRNVFIANCTASNGTVDYFKWDPESEDTALKTPHITFDIVDVDPHNYCVIIRFRQTVGEGTWNWFDGMRVVLGSNTNANINLTEPDADGKCLNANEHAWGTYTYDLIVLEYEGETPVWTQQQALDWDFLKRYRDGYHLWVPENLPAPHDDKEGHDVWFEMPDEDTEELRAYYSLHTDFDGLAAESVQLVAIDPHLTEQASIPGATQTGQGHGTDDADQDGHFDGLLCYELRDEDVGGTWRVVVTAVDGGGRRSPECRTHRPLPMLAANGPDATYEIEYITGVYEDRTWYGAWCRRRAYLKTVLFPRALPRRVWEYTETGSHPDVPFYEFVDDHYYPLDYKVRAGVNGGFFSSPPDDDPNDDEVPHPELGVFRCPVGYVGCGTHNWQGNPVQTKRRWGFSFRNQDAGGTAVVLRDAEASPGSNWYKYASDLADQPYGLSGVGCRVRNESAETAGYPVPSSGPNERCARTCVAWSTGGSLFLIVSTGVAHSTGWTWPQMASFFTDGDDADALPRKLKSLFSGTVKHTITIDGAMSLDGGGSSSFRYCRVTRTEDGYEWSKNERYDAQEPGRLIPDLVLGSAASRPGSSGIQPQ